MITHYNGFISYRHCPVDSKVAEEVQHQLERFTIPKALQKKTGIKKIERIFRDKEELPITMDINENIGDAIRNSDFLILICSPHTQESQWVMREIDLFLQTHTKDHILTVLSEGDPAETIPRILRYEEEEDPETGELVRTEIEPLSSDFRLPFRKARQVELPRLLAAMLGVSYDEIVQRTHQYQVRRRNTILSVIAAALSIFTGYVIYSNLQIREANEKLADTNLQLEDTNNQLADTNLQLEDTNNQLADTNLKLEDTNRQLEDTNIQLEDTNRQLEDSYEEVQKNYEQSLRNQSEYLAAESLKALESGDRILAVQLARAALVDGDENRPEVTKAIYALEQALGAYQFEEKSMVGGSFILDAEVFDYQTNSEQTVLYALDAAGRLTAWNMEDYAKYYSVQTAEEPNQLLYVNDSLIIASGKEGYIAAFDAETGESLWKLDISEDKAYNQIYQLSENTAFVVGKQGLHYGTIRLTDGAFLNEWTIEQEDTQKYLANYAGVEDCFHVLDGEKKIQFLLRIKQEDNTTLSYPVIIDTETGDIQIAASGDYDVYCTLCTDEAVYVFITKDAFNEMNDCQIISNGVTQMVRSQVEMKLEKYTYDSAGFSEEPEWSRTFTGSRGCAMMYFDESQESMYLFRTRGNISRIRLSDGEILGEGFIDDDIIYVQAADDYAVFITRNGGIGGFRKNGDTFITFLEDDIYVHDVAKYRSGCISQENSSQIFRYTKISDKNIEIVNSQNTDASSYVCDDTRMFLLDSTNNRLSCIDTAEKKETWFLDQENPEGLAFCEFIGLTSDGKKLVVKCKDKVDQYIFAVFQTGTGECQEIITNHPAYDCLGMFGDVLYFREYQSDQGYVLLGVPVTADAKNFCEDYCALPVDQISYLQAYSKGFSLQDLYGELYFWNPISGEFLETGIIVDNFKSQGWYMGGTRYLGMTAENVVLLDDDGKLLYTYAHKAEETTAAFMTSTGIVLIAANDGKLYGYDESGVLLGVIDLSEYSLYSAGYIRNAEMVSETEVLLTTKDYLRGAFLVDLEEWAVCEWSEHFINRFKDTDTYIIRDRHSEYVFGICPAYTKETLLEKANTLLKNIEMKESLKKAYGLSSSK